MVNDESPLGGPLELPGSEQRSAKPRVKRGRLRGLFKKLLIVIGILILMALIGFGVGKLLNRKKTPASSAKTTSQNPTTSSPTALKVSDVPEVAGTKTFTSTALGVTLTYPVGWTTNETGGGVRIESPDFNYMTTDKGVVAGNFRVYIRKGARETDSKYIARGVATQPSEPLTYSAPTSIQRKTTNLSFFGLDTPDQFAYFLIAGNFNLKKGDTLGPNYGKEADTVLVTGGYSAKSLADDFATNQVPLGSFQQTNAYKQAIDIIKSLKLQ